jgi:hypothetical protein
VTIFAVHMCECSGLFVNFFLEHRYRYWYFHTFGFFINYSWPDKAYYNHPLIALAYLCCCLINTETSSTRLSVLSVYVCYALI